VVVPGDDRPRLGDRICNPRIWPRGISLFPDEFGVDLGNGKLVEWGLEQGRFPYGGYDGSDAWVGLVGTDQNGDGKLQPEEVEGVIGRCPVGGVDNNFYVDEDGTVHWLNYDDPKGPEKVNLPYIYDPRRDILKRYKGSQGDGTLIYIGPPRDWPR